MRPHYGIPAECCKYKQKDEPGGIAAKQKLMKRNPHHLSLTCSTNPFEEEYKIDLPGRR